MCFLSDHELVQLTTRVCSNDGLSVTGDTVPWFREAVVKHGLDVDQFVLGFGFLAACNLVVSSYTLEVQLTAVCFSLGQACVIAQTDTYLTVPAQKGVWAAHRDAEGMTPRRADDSLFSELW